MCWSFLTTYDRPLCCNDRSRLATVESLVEHGTYRIDDSPFKKTVDRVPLDGHFIPTKPPVLSTAMAGEYWLLRHTLGLELGDKTQMRYVVRILCLSFVGVPFIFSCVLLRSMLHWYIEASWARLVTIFAACFATLAAGFSITINNHVPAAALLMSGFYLAVGLGNAKLKPTPIRFVLAGLVTGLLPTVDLPGMFFSILCWVYLVWKFPKKTLVWFSIGAVPPLLVHFCLNHAASGSLLPVYLQKHLYDYEGTYWRTPKGVDALREPKWLYLFHITIGHSGLFSLFPVFLLSAGGVVAAFFRKSFPLRRETLALGGLVVVWIAFYTFASHNYGGEAYGMRWFIPFMPAFLFPAAALLDRIHRRWQWVLVGILLLVSLFSAWECASHPWNGRRLWTVSIFGEVV